MSLNSFANDLNRFSSQELADLFAKQPLTQPCAEVTPEIAQSRIDNAITEDPESSLASAPDLSNSVVLLPSSAAI